MAVVDNWRHSPLPGMSAEFCAPLRPIMAKSGALPTAFFHQRLIWRPRLLVACKASLPRSLFADVSESWTLPKKFLGSS